jgi:hypothetical protein
MDAMEHYGHYAQLWLGYGFPDVGKMSEKFSSRNHKNP